MFKDKMHTTECSGENNSYTTVIYSEGKYVPYYQNPEVEIDYIASFITETEIPLDNIKETIKLLPCSLNMSIGKYVPYRDRTVTRKKNIDKFMSGIDGKFNIKYIYRPYGEVPYETVLEHIVSCIEKRTI